MRGHVLHAKTERNVGDKASRYTKYLYGSDLRHNWNDNFESWVCETKATAMLLCTDPTPARVEAEKIGLPRAQYVSHLWLKNK